MRFLFNVVLVSLLILISCSKKEDISPQPVNINTIKISQETIGVGQLISISADVSDSTRIVNYNWSISTLAGNQPIIGSGKNINWAPKSKGDYKISLRITDNSGHTSEYAKSISVKICDFRWAFWQDNPANVAVNEGFYNSKFVTADAHIYTYQAQPKDDYGVVKSGDFVSYEFVNEKLTSALILFQLPYDEYGGVEYNQEFENKYLSLIDEFTSSVTNIKDSVSWQNNYYANEYKKRGEIYEGMLRGYSTVSKTWEMGSSSCALIMSSDGSSSISFSAYFKRKK